MKNIFTFSLITRYGVSLLFFAVNAALAQEKYEYAVILYHSDSATIVIEKNGVLEEIIKLPKGEFMGTAL